MPNILFSGTPGQWPAYEKPLTSAFEALGLKANLMEECAPEEVDYIIYSPKGPVQDFAAFTRAKGVFSLWAGVEKIVGNRTLNIPLTRMVDDGLSQGMMEWVTGHVLRHHLGMDAHIINPDHDWVQVPPPLAPERPVSILGLGALGQRCAEALKGLGFPVTGWSRSPKSVPGIRCLSGNDGLHEALRTAEILVLLLPFTAETENTLNAGTLALLPKGAVVINPGRGPLIDDDALLQTLDSGQISHATLDVFRVEPLPQDHPFWTHEHVTVTPHIAADTRASTAAKVIAENVRRGEAGEPFLYLVDRSAGY